MLNNWAADTTTTTGTGSLTLASISNWPTINNVVGTNKYFRYAIVDDTTGAPLAAGVGYLSASTTLVRDTAETTYTGGTYTPAGSVLSLPSGTKRVIVTALAEDMVPALPGVVGSSFSSKFVVPDGLQPSTNSKTLTANQVRTSCLRFACARPVNSLVCSVNTAAGTGTDRIQLGIYQCNNDGLPGALIARTGDIAPNSTGIKTATLVGGDIILPAGWYWFAIASNVAPAVSAYNAGSVNTATLATPMGHVTNTLTSRQCVATATLSGGWTELPASITLTAVQSITAEFAPTVGTLVT